MCPGGQWSSSAPSGVHGNNGTIHQRSSRSSSVGPLFFSDINNKWSFVTFFPLPTFCDQISLLSCCCFFFCSIGCTHFSVQPSIGELGDNSGLLSLFISHSSKIGSSCCCCCCCSSSSSAAPSSHLALLSYLFFCYSAVSGTGTTPSGPTPVRETRKDCRCAFRRGFALENIKALISGNHTRLLHMSRTITT